MKPIRPVFDGAAKTVRMDAARYVNPANGHEKIVQPPGTPLKKDHAYYYEPTHKGYLHCLHCDANVRLRPASDTAVSGSSLKGNAASFALVAGQRHDTACEFYAEPKKSAARKKTADDGKGYRIHINTQEYSDLYTPKDGSYSRRGAITEINDPDLADREIYTVKSAADLVDFMMTKDTDRVIRSVVVFGNGKPIPWQDFFIRYNRGANDQPRFMALFERLQAGGKGAQIPVLMEMQLRKPVTVNGYGKTLSVPSRKIPYKQDADGTRHDIVPAANLDRESALHNTGVSGAFSYGTHHLVLGLATLNHPNDGHYYINVIVTDPAQVTTVNIENVMKRAVAKARIGQLPTPESGPKDP